MFDTYANNPSGLVGTQHQTTGFATQLLSFLSNASVTGVSGVAVTPVAAGSGLGGRIEVLASFSAWREVQNAMDFVASCRLCVGFDVGAVHELCARLECAPACATTSSSTTRTTVTTLTTTVTTAAITPNSTAASGAAAAGTASDGPSAVIIVAIMAAVCFLVVLVLLLAVVCQRSTAANQSMATNKLMTRQGSARSRQNVTRDNQMIDSILYKLKISGFLPQTPKPTLAGEEEADDFVSTPAVGDFVAQPARAQTGAGAADDDGRSLASADMMEAMALPLPASGPSISPTSPDMMEALAQGARGEPTGSRNPQQQELPASPRSQALQDLLSEPREYAINATPANLAPSPEPDEAFRALTPVAFETGDHYYPENSVSATTTQF